MGRFESNLHSSPNPSPKSSNPQQWPLASPYSAQSDAPPTVLSPSRPSSDAGEAAPMPKMPPFATNAAPELDDRSDEEDMESSAEPECEVVEMEALWSGGDWTAAWPRRSRVRAPGGVMLEGYVEVPVIGGDGGSDDGASTVGRTKSLTDDDLEELKGCLDLGFGFSYDEIPELCNTLPALELCYSMSRSLELSGDGAELCSAAASASALAVAASPPTNWKISSPGDDPEEVKARLKYWAQTVACTVRLCK